MADVPLELYCITFGTTQTRDASFIAQASVTFNLNHVQELTFLIAGKDRTGVLAALLLKLAGVDDDTVAEDYALTRVGREPARETVMARLAKMPMFASDNERAMNMLTSR